MTELPTTFGKYFLTEKLAIGGMAEIYLAKLMGPGGFEKQLVIKKIHPRLSGQRHFVDLFVTEAKTLVTLTHGNIVPVYELGVIDDTYFIAMEYIDGPTLYRLTETLARREARMEPALAAWIAARILEGLDYAHRKGEGVIHRDLSPRNVMLSRDGEVKLVDFGIAVTLGAADDGVDVQSAPTGSFPYMSPEQVRREPLSGQTDLFSVGVLLWEMLVGHRLFARNDPDATLAAVTDSEIRRPSTERPDIPARLDDVVMRALARDREARWPSAAEMLAQLQRFLYSLEDPPGPRDLAALVARTCPPETRRFPTHTDPAEVAELAGARTEVTPPPGPPDPPGPGGPRTAVVPREADAPRGKPRARTETFATNVELKQLLERATPLFPIAAITDEPARATDGGVAGVTGPRTTVTPAPLAVAARQPPSRGVLLLAALGTLALGVGAVVVFLRGGPPAAVDDAGVGRPDDAGLDAGPDAAATPDAGSPVVGLDAALLDAGPIRPLPDAEVALAPPRDAGVRIRGDAVAPVLDAAPRVTGTATLKVGAEPWGEIVIDGQPRGRTPAALELPAGKHVVEVIYRGEDPPRTKRFPINLGAGTTEQVQADFTKP